MPRIIYKNISPEDVCVLSKELSRKSAEIVGCPVDWLTFECVHNYLFVDGDDQTMNTLFIEVEWFKRSQDQQDELAMYLYEELTKRYTTREITIIFKDLNKEDYYEEGKNFS